jgi:hypothetical protein
VKMIYKKYLLQDEIPVRNVLRNKKLAKYFNRETALGIVCLAELLQDAALKPETPVFYETGLIEYEDFGLDTIAEVCVKDMEFSPRDFVEKGMSSISPLTQFKILLNMPLCFFSIENNLTGDNAVIYSSASGLLTHAYLADTEDDMLIGAGKVNADGSVESGFAVCRKSELYKFQGDYGDREGIEIFRSLNKGVNNA